MDESSFQKSSSASLPESLVSPLRLFLTSMQEEKRLAPNTIDAYRRDLHRYLSMLAERGLDAPGQAGPEHVRELLHQLREAGLSPATVSRNLSSIKRFHHFLQVQGNRGPDPTEGLTPPRTERKAPQILSIEEVSVLLDSTQSEEPLGTRDRGILELLYASGLRVTELISLRLSQLLIETALLRVFGKGARERLVPIGRQAISSLESYLREGRPFLARPDSEDFLFLNFQGGPLSRMSVWKIIRSATGKAGLDKPVSPHTLRHSFASHLLAGGANLRDIQELLGHADISSTQIYQQVDSSYLKEVHRTYHPRA